MGEMHMGPIMDKIDGFARHCETLLPNHACPYLAFGCLGCTRRWPVDTQRLPSMLSDGTFATPRTEPPSMTLENLRSAVRKIEEAMLTFFPYVKLYRTSYGDDWPLTVEEGVLQLRSNNQVVFVANGKPYAVNGTAKAETYWGLEQPRYRPIDEIWADDPAGGKKDLSRLIAMGLALKD